jgi:hypothetical protein
VFQPFSINMSWSFLSQTRKLTHIKQAIFLFLSYRLGSHGKMHTQVCLLVNQTQTLSPTNHEHSLFSFLKILDGNVCGFFTRVDQEIVYDMYSHDQHVIYRIATTKNLQQSSCNFESVIKSGLSVCVCTYCVALI